LDKVVVEKILELSVVQRVNNYPQVLHRYTASPTYTTNVQYDLKVWAGAYQTRTSASSFD